MKQNLIKKKWQLAPFQVLAPVFITQLVRGGTTEKCFFWTRNELKKVLTSLIGPCKFFKKTFSVGKCHECDLQSGVVRKNRFLSGRLRKTLMMTANLSSIKFNQKLFSLDSDETDLVDRRSRPRPKCSFFAIYFSVGKHLKWLIFQWKNILLTF